MNTDIARMRAPFEAERAARARRLARPQPSVPLICGHEFFTRGHLLTAGAAVWCVRCGYASEVSA